MKEFNRVITVIIGVNSYAQMVKNFHNSSVKHVEYDEPVSDFVIEEVEKYCDANDIAVTKVDGEILDIHMEFCDVRLKIK